MMHSNFSGAKAITGTRDCGTGDAPVSWMTAAVNQARQAVAGMATVFVDDTKVCVVLLLHHLDEIPLVTIVEPPAHMNIPAPVWERARCRIEAKSADIVAVARTALERPLT